MGGAINRSFISVHFLLSTYYFLTAQTYMCLITRVYSNYIHNRNRYTIFSTIFVVLANN